jgi:hypothetical protein
MIATERKNRQNLVERMRDAVESLSGCTQSVGFYEAREIAEAADVLDEAAMEIERLRSLKPEPTP